MGSTRLEDLRREHPGRTDEQIACEVVESSDAYRFAVRYTSRFAPSEAPTDIAFGVGPAELREFMSLRNAQLLYAKAYTRPDDGPGPRVVPPDDARRVSAFLRRLFGMTDAGGMRRQHRTQARGPDS